MHVLKLPLFASLYKLPEQFQSDLIACVASIRSLLTCPHSLLIDPSFARYADHMIKRQVESANASATFHKTHPVRVIAYIAYKKKRVIDLFSFFLVVYIAVQCCAAISGRENCDPRTWWRRLVPHI